MKELLDIVGNVGFPIAVSAYLLIRIEGKLSVLSTAIAELREAIITLPHSSQWLNPRTPVAVNEDLHSAHDQHPPV